MLAIMLEFGLKGNIGAERMSAFFHRVRLEKHVGVSLSALRDKLSRLEDAIHKYGTLQEREQAKQGVVREITGGGDETFFAELMLIVMMDLSSGYIIVEEPAPDRCYETWRERAQIRLEELNLRVRHFISDRGASLIKLALDGFGCRSGADIFHAQYDVSKWLGVGFFRKLGKACKAVNSSEKKLAALKEKESSPEKIKACEQKIEWEKEQEYKLEQGKKTYSKAQQAVSEGVHPFSVQDSSKQSSSQVENALNEQARKFEEIARTHDISDPSGMLNKFKRQFQDISSMVEAWWIWAEENVKSLALSQNGQDWALYVLLPVIYWHQQMQRCQHSEIKQTYQKAYEKSLADYASHPFTQTLSEQESERYREWAEWMSAKFQRSSSAIEGRNGCLSQIHHCGRGLSARRLKTHTVIHNFDMKRADGTTPAERLFGTKFPDLFEWLLDESGELPLPRKARHRSKCNPLNLQTVAA